MADVLAIDGSNVLKPKKNGEATAGMFDIELEVVIFTKGNAVSDEG